MKYVDVHAHLEDSKFDGIREDVIKRFSDKDIYVINAGLDPETNRKSLELARKYSHILPGLGLYPTNAEGMNLGQVEKEIEFIKNVRPVAVSEIGMDLYKSTEHKDKQEEVFRMMLDLAQKLDVPAVVHSRGAEEHVFEVLKDYDMKVVIHCFGSSNKDLLLKGVDRGYHFSVPPLVKISTRFQKIVSLVPDKLLLLETDSPYMSPWGAARTNEPVHILDTLAKMREIKGIDMSKKMLENSRKLFRL